MKTATHFRSCIYDFAVVACLLSGFGAIAGCKNPNELETAPVSGKVVMNGKPLTRGTVTFSPKRGRAAKGEIQTDGTFELSTYRSGDGAIVGNHKVAVLVLRPDIDPKVGPEQGKPIMAIPAHYATPEESGLEYDVKSGQKNEFTLELHDP